MLWLANGTMCSWKLATLKKLSDPPCWLHSSWTLHSFPQRSKWRKKAPTFAKKVMFTFQAASLRWSLLLSIISSTISGTVATLGFCLSRNSTVCLNSINQRRSMRARTNFWLSRITGDAGRSLIGRPPLRSIIYGTEGKTAQPKKLGLEENLFFLFLSYSFYFLTPRDQLLTKFRPSRVAGLSGPKKYFLPSQFSRISLAFLSRFSSIKRGTRRNVSMSVHTIRSLRPASM